MKRKHKVLYQSWFLNFPDSHLQVINASKLHIHQHQSF